MGFPKLPDWLIYIVAVGAILAVCLVRRDYAHAPPAPPPADVREGALVGPTSAAIDPLKLVQAPQGPLLTEHATAFAISSQGRWLTAMHAVADCRKAAIMMGGGLALPAEIRSVRGGDVALLLSPGGPTPLPIAQPKPPHDGQKGFAPGYPQGRAGELALRYIGPDTLKLGGRDSRVLTVQAWAEIGRTDELGEQLAGLAGAPVLDDQGRVLGVVLATRPRKGRVFTTAPQMLKAAARLAGAASQEPAVGELIGAENYGRMADDLRRDTRVAEVRCLTYR
jgi:hypothetical protein